MSGVPERIPQITNATGEHPVAGAGKARAGERARRRRSGPSQVPGSTGPSLRYPENVFYLPFAPSALAGAIKFSGVSVSPDADVTRHWLTPLARLGDERAESEKVRLVANAADIMSPARVKPSLISDIRTAAWAAEPIGSDVLTAKPDIEKYTEFEGRGVYRRVRINGRDVYLYVKGIGSVNNIFRKTNDTFPGYPGRPESFYYDSPLTQSHPRIRGADYVSSSLRELSSSLVFFEHLAEKFGWTSLNQVVNSGVTVPLFVTEFPELTEQLLAQADAIKQSVTHPGVVANLDWGDMNRSVGSVSQLVPSHNRLGRTLDTRRSTDITTNELMDPQVWENAGRTQRELLEAGIVYCQESAHGDNHYANGLYVQADNADLVYLGDFFGKIQYVSATGETITVPPQIAQASLIFQQLNRDGLMTPPYFPVPSAEISFEDVTQAQTAYWQEILQGQVNADAMPLLAKLMPFLRTEINLAVAHKFATRKDKSQWARNAVRKDEIFEQYSEYSVNESYQEMVQDNVSGVDLEGITAMYGSNLLPVASVHKYMKTANIKDLIAPEGEADPRIIGILRLSKALDNLADKKVRDEILFLAGRYFSKRDITILKQKPDPLVLFDGFQALMLAGCIEDGRTDEAITMLKLFALSNKTGFADSFRPDGYPEPARLLYTRELTRFGDIDELYDQCEYDNMLYDFSLKTHLTRPSDEPQGDLEEDLSMYLYARDHGLPSPQRVIRALVGELITADQQDTTRKKVRIGVESYLLAQQLLENRLSTGKGDVDLAVRAIDIFGERLRNLYPELGFGHDCYMAYRLQATDRQRALTYRQSAISYYDTQFRNRTEETGMNYVFEERTAEIRKRDFGELAELYEMTHFPVIAQLYKRYQSAVA